jgi:hypothetical protein
MAAPTVLGEAEELGQVSRLRGLMSGAQTSKYGTVGNYVYPALYL